MKSNKKTLLPDTSGFITAVGNLATEFGWSARSSEREGEAVVVALTTMDSFFERFIWVFDTNRISLRCMLVSTERIPPKLQNTIFEFCARVNDSLPFGCIEFSFAEKVLVFRDSTDLDWGPVDQVVRNTTSRVLNLGKVYAKAVQLTIAGENPADAIRKAEESS